jgi:hypothetical protein
MQNKLMKLMFENRTLVTDNLETLVERAEDTISESYMLTGKKKIYVTPQDLYVNEKGGLSSVAIRDNIDLVRDGLRKHGYLVEIEERYSTIDGYIDTLVVSV